MAQEDEQSGDWRSAESYRLLTQADASTWAWEFARRAASVKEQTADLCFAGLGPKNVSTPVAMWRYEADPSIPVFEGAPTVGGDGRAFDVRTFKPATLVVSSEAGDQHILVVDGTRRLRFAVIGADVLKGPLRLGFRLPDWRDGVIALDSVKRLVRLRDTGRLTAGPRPPAGKSARWVEAIRAFDARRGGASHREIARLLYGDERVSEEWNGRSDYMRMRVHRLLRSAESLAAGGYRKLLGLRAPGAPQGRARIWRSTTWSVAAATTASLWAACTEAPRLPGSCLML